jgi:hypothetical protein
MKGTITDNAGGEYDPLYCRNDACGGAGTYVDNVVGMGFTDPNRQPYEGTFGPIKKYVDPLPPFTSSNQGYAVRFIAPRSGRIQFITNHGNFSGRPPRAGQLQFDLYRYSEPSGPSGPGPGTSDPETGSTGDPCADVARAAQVSKPCPEKGRLFPGPTPGKVRRLILKLPANAKVGELQVAATGKGPIVLAATGRPQRVRQLFDTYVRWCALTVAFSLESAGEHSDAIYSNIFGFKTIGIDDSGGSVTSLCKLAAIQATVRAIEAEDAAAKKAQGAAFRSPVGACRAGAIAATKRTSRTRTAVGRAKMPRLGAVVKCRRNAQGVTSLRIEVTPYGKTLRRVFGGTTAAFFVARGKTGDPNGQFAYRWRTR